MKPELTIVVPVYNRATVVEATLRSIAAQTLRPLAVVLVDNASTDNSLEVLRRWQKEHSCDELRVEVIECAKRGACNARNAGLEHVDTEWTMFFDSDDQMKPGHCMRAMQYAEGADVVGWNMMMYHQDGSPYRSMPFVNHDLLYNNIMLSSFSTQRYMARTELFRHAGGWLPDAQVYDDVELGVRLLKLNPRIAKAAGKATVDVYITEGSIYTDTTDKLSRITVALDAIEAELPANQRHWVDLQRLLKASTWGKDDPAAPALARDVLARQPWMRRMLWRLFYRYSLRGGRGVARLYRPLTYLGF